LYRSFGIVWSISRCRIGKTYMFLRRCRCVARVDFFPWKWNFIQLLAWNVPQHLLLMTFSIWGCRVMMNTNLKQFLSRFLVANYIFITKTITHKIAIFQTQQTDYSTAPPWEQFNLPRRTCGVTWPTPTRVFPQQEWRAWERVRKGRIIRV
jgi:hypothetical protein